MNLRATLTRPAWGNFLPARLGGWLLAMILAEVMAGAQTAPSITQQPQAQTVSAGSTVQFSVVVSSTGPVTYQWSKGAQTIPNGTNQVLTLPAVTVNDAVAYSVVATTLGVRLTSNRAQLNVIPVDFGDAPSDYPVTRAKNGAAHALQAGLSLGKAPDSEPDGQPSADATGDDNNPSTNDDEDGITFLTTIDGGKTASFRAVVSLPPAALVVPGTLDCWFDFNRNGSWSDPGEYFRFSQVPAGTNQFSFAVPADAVGGKSYARFRLSIQGVSEPTGISLAGGEVEDYQINIVPAAMDFGDAPKGYPVLLSEDGARHVFSGDFFLGQRIDTELDGFPSSDARGDDLNSANNVDDEDGIKFLDPLVPGTVARIEVTASSKGLLSAWIDFNRNTSWDDASDAVFIAASVVAGTQVLQFEVPKDASVGPTFARFRYGTSRITSPRGLALNGEVEDYAVNIDAPTLYDFGDAPEFFNSTTGLGTSYPTTLARNGARHKIVKGVYLGSSVDDEKDGQPVTTALGDDTSPVNGADDEDGIVFLDQLVPGKDARIQVTSSTVALLSAWIDFNRDGDWSDSGEAILLGAGTSGGTQIFNIKVPADAVPGLTYARFRFSTAFINTVSGEAPDGEVEDYAITMQEPVKLDFGDAPEPYPTTLARDGARHRYNSDIFLGSLIDTEPDGQPNAGATGDDGSPVGAASDEDGIQFLDPLRAGTTARIQVRSSTKGFLSAWFDWNRDGDWDDAGELALLGATLPGGTTILSIDVPASAVDGASFARFRFSSRTVDKPTGEWPDGEVEDYSIRIDTAKYDFGDAPFRSQNAKGVLMLYPTRLAENGARHLVDPRVFLGPLKSGKIDAEFDGQPTLDALGDDGNPAGAADDEDGVQFPEPLTAGETVKIIVSSSVKGFLSAWFDFNANGNWNDPGELVFLGTEIPGGEVTLNLPIQGDAIPGPTYARFRFSAQSKIESPSGEAKDGEVEDYLVEIKEAVPFDFGDAPDQPYPTLLANNGARHRINPDVYLGDRVDAEKDGQPGNLALGDDNNPAGGADDEDGVVFLTPIEVGKVATVQVKASTKGKLSAWIDFNHDGDWDDPGEFAIQMVDLAPGLNVVTFKVPPAPGALGGRTMARFRFALTPIQDYRGEAPNGEVEDYLVSISDPPKLDFGDAPESGEIGYPTTLARDGARHTVKPGFSLGKLVDVESDGQPSVNANGDDIAGSGGDDEDGVRFLGPLIAGETVRIEVTASAQGLLDAWIDFNRNLTWGDASDRIANARVLNPGINILTVTVPASAKPGPTYARFRLSLKGGLDYKGDGGEGEVEDYEVRILPSRPCDLGCTGTNFWLAFPGNYAPDPANPVKPSLSIVGSPGTAVTVSAPGVAFGAAIVIPAGGLSTVTLPSSVDLGDSNDQTNHLGIHVTSSEPVAVHGLSRVKMTSDGYHALSTEVIGNEYIVLGYRNTHAAVPELNGTQFAIVATETNTVITVIPSVATQDHDAGVPYYVYLEEGQTYQLRHIQGAPGDLSGTILLADKPIAVFGSHQCANVPSGGKAFCDYLVEQLTPVQRWGTEYFTHPLATRTGYSFRVAASEDDTQVQIDGAPAGTLNRGDVMSRVVAVNSGRQITANKRILVMQYAESSDADLVVNSDPFMVLAPQRNLFSTTHVFAVPAGFADNYMNVVVKSGTVLTLDGGAIAPAYTPIGASGFLGAQIPLGPGKHVLTASKPAGAIVYGWDKYESYAWPACLFFGDTTPPDMVCPTEEIKIALPTGNLANNPVPCKMPLPDLRSQAKYSDNCQINTDTQVQQDPPPGTLVGVGSYEVELSVTDAQGNVGRCTVIVTVIDSNPQGDPWIDCPAEIKKKCTNPAGAVVEYTVTGYKGCTPVDVVCVPPSGSQFPVGTTKVHCMIHSPGVPPVECEFNVVVSCGVQPVLVGSLVSVTPSSKKLVLNWDPSDTLIVEIADSPAGPWTILEGAQPGFEVDVLKELRKFYRLREP